MNEHTIDKIIRDRARITPERIAIDEDGRTWTYAELDLRSDELARCLSRGDRVSTLTGNSGEHVALMFACAKAGAMLHPISWRLAPAEIAYQLDDAEPAFFLIEDEHRALGEAALQLASVTPALELGSASRDESDPQVADDDPLLLIYTSGTTGKPKGALLTHANSFWTNLSFDLATGIRPDDVVLQVLPQFHCGGWNVQSILAWWKGAKVVLERGFDPARSARARRARANHLVDGCPRELSVHRPGAAIRGRGPQLAPARRGRRSADAVGAAGRLGRAWYRDRAGLRAHRGRAECALPAARGRAAQGGIRRQALSVRQVRPLDGGRAARARPERLRRLLA